MLCSHVPTRIEPKHDHKVTSPTTVTIRGHLKMVLAIHCLLAAQFIVPGATDCFFVMPPRLIGGDITNIESCSPPEKC